MLETHVSQTVFDSASAVLETMCFACVLGPAEDGIFLPEESVASTVSFKGDLAGRMMVAVPDGYARNLASSFLGVEEGDVSPIMTRQFISELTNMICGSVLTELDSNGDFQLASPVAEPATASAEMSCLHVLDTGDGVVAIGLRLEGADERRS